MPSARTAFNDKLSKTIGGTAYAKTEEHWTGEGRGEGVAQQEGAGRLPGRIGTVRGGESEHEPQDRDVSHQPAVRAVQEGEYRLVCEQV